MELSGCHDREKRTEWSIWCPFCGGVIVLCYCNNSTKLADSRWCFKHEDKACKEFYKFVDWRAERDAIVYKNCDVHDRLIEYVEAMGLSSVSLRSGELPIWVRVAKSLKKE